ncbi:hypothetical protein CHARACLAT_012187 [Characodon lateralis]|uniref:Uncharacterized protein n=1 Tax=Characodon lateralis TaxID=208331 RepID=A0ABU7F2D4_9TELE|nr:hypothetical protein [Characodon lateralis]
MSRWDVGLAVAMGLLKKASQLPVNEGCWGRGCAGGPPTPEDPGAGVFAEQTVHPRGASESHVSGQR